MRNERETLETKLKQLESTLNDYQSNVEYIECKNKLEEIYETVAKGVRIRSKCNWYEQGEKSTKFFLNLEKSRAVQGQIHTLLVNDKLVQNLTEINKEIYNFYNTLFWENNCLAESNITSYLDQTSLPKLNHEQVLECERQITENEITNALKPMKNDKSPGNDGLTKEFHETFWEDLKSPLMASVNKAYLVGELSTSQKQAVIKLIEKKDRDKRLIKNWRPISLLNLDTKLIF